MSGRGSTSDHSEGVWTELADPAVLAAQAGTPGTSFSLAVKANIGVRGFTRSAGCRILDRRVEDSDAPVVAAFRAAGAVVVGMTNMHELALGVTSENVSYGPVRLPTDRAYSAGGSSGGSAAAVASGAVPLALGTDTGGSVSIPASHCGVVGFRPSTGRWPTAGSVGLSWTRDTPGVFATSVEDAIRADAWVTGARLGVTPSVPRLGVPRELVAELAPRTARAFSAVLESLATEAELVEVSFAQVLERTRRAEPVVVGWESRRGLGVAASHALGLAPDAAFSTLVAGVESPDVAAFLDRELAHPVRAEEYAAAQRDTIAARIIADDMLVARELDGLIFPTTPAPAPLVGAGTEVEHLGHQVPLFELYTRNTGQGTMLGVPMVTLPMPVHDGGTPIGLTLQGPRNGDRGILALADRLFRLLS